MDYIDSDALKTKWEKRDQVSAESFLPNYAPSVRECYSNPQHDINVFGSEDVEQDSDHKHHEYPEHLNQHQHTFHPIDSSIMYNSQGTNAPNYPGQNDSDDPAEHPHYSVHQDLMMANELGLTPRNNQTYSPASYQGPSITNMAPYSYYSHTTAYHRYQGMQSPDYRFSNFPQYMQGNAQAPHTMAMQGIQYPNTALPPSPASTERRDSYQPTRPCSTESQSRTQDPRFAEAGSTPLPSFEATRNPIVPTSSDREVDDDADGESEIESEGESKPPEKSRKSLLGAKPSTKSSTAKASSPEPSTRATKASTPATKKHHNEVEKSYRVRLNGHIDALSRTIFGEPRDNRRDGNSSNSRVFKHPKALVIATAKGNIEDLRSKNTKLAEEVEELKRKLAIREHHSKPPPGPPSGRGPPPGGNGGGMRV